MAAAHKTTDHEKIRIWVEARNGYPATVRDTKTDGEPGLLRIDFPGYSGEETLERIDWESFFKKFEKEDLAFLYQDEDDSRFCKMVSR